ncbi:MAG: B12-binding domain-containing radical SAM protein [Nitrospinota bacterium]|nr:B12-binding domain-containing radical SAM protein [Nitrospinota bacterium]
MKVLFVYTDIDVKGGARSYHFGLGLLSSVLKQAGHTTELHYMFDAWDPEGFEAHVDTFSPDVIGYTSDSSQIRHVVKLVKRMSGRGIFQVAGGVHSSLYPKFMESVDGLDAICTGEGEGPVLELVTRLAKREDVTKIPGLWVRQPDGAIRKNLPGLFIEDLNSIPFGDREMFNYQQVVKSDYDRATFMLSRGCPYNCNYCGSPSMGRLQEGKYVRFRSVENGIAEIKDIVGRYDIRKIFFADDVFTIDRKYVKEFCETYKKEIGIPFEVTTRVESSHIDTFKYLADAGCTRVAMGIESGSEELRRKHLNRKMTNGKIIQAFADARAAGLKTKSYNIVGFPHETYEMHLETVELNRQINPDSLVIYIFNPYPGTALFDISIRDGFLSPDFMDEDFISRTDTPLTMPQFTREEILKAYRNFAFSVYRGQSARKALLYKVYYSRFGEPLIRLLDSVKKPIQKLAMGS